MAFESLFAGLKMFQEGVRDYATNQALAEARSQIDMLNSQAMKQEEKFAAMNELSRGLTQQMLQIGATPQQVAQAASAFAPQQFENSEAMFKQGVMAGDSGLQQQAAKVQEFEQKPKRELMQIQSSRALMAAQLDAIRGDRSLQRETRGAIMTAGKEFESQIKDMRKQLQSATMLEQGLSAKNPVIDSSMGVAFNRLIGNVGTLTDQELANIGADRALISKAGNAWSQMSSGNMSPTNRKLVSDAVKVFQRAAAEGIVSNARTNADQVASVYDLDPEYVRTKILPPAFEQELSRFRATPPAGQQQQQQRGGSGAAAPARRSLLDYRE